MLLVFSHFFVPTMQLCPVGSSVLRLNTEVIFPIPWPCSSPDTALPWLCRDTRSPTPGQGSPGQGPAYHCQTPTGGRTCPQQSPMHRQWEGENGFKPALMTAAIPAGAGFPLHQGEGAPGGFTTS